MEISPASPIVRAPSRAAQYVRMSTEHQQYSPENQLDVIRQYAADHNMDIVQAYSDHGRSGLNIVGREGLNQLMSDVEAKRTDFTSLLVYDVSRWGRFQDVDESAYYEYVLKRAGIRPTKSSLPLRSRLIRRCHSLQLESSTASSRRSMS
ncbi:MAG: recombinase family protein [Acidobacteriaceae bacterium]